MYKTVLVKKLIDDGAFLLETLEGRHFPISAALWFYHEESTTWKLVIVSDVANTSGPGEAYLRIQQAMAGLDLDLALDDIMIMSPQSKTFKDLRRRIEGVANVASLIRKTFPKGISFGDAHVYRWPD